MNQQDNNQDKPCRTAHVFGGKVPTVNDVHLKGKVCDCNRFVMDIQGCNCNGTKKVVLKPNRQYAAGK